MQRFNPTLPFILDGYRGNPVDKNGRYVHPEYPFELGWTDIAKWKSRANPYAAAKKKDSWRATVLKDGGFLKNNKDAFVWLGHASFFFRLNGINLLIDPVFGKLSFIMPRYSDLPVDPNQFNKIDYILLTHDHRDHCDLPSLKLLIKNNPNVQFITGLGMTGVIDHLIDPSRITEMGWFQQIHHEKHALKLSYLPTRHWCRRYLTDTNKRLWGAYVLQTGQQTIYFGGDSGYGSHFKSTADLFPNIDYAFLGIGAFAPIWFMESNHMSPLAAFDAFQDLKAQQFVPMHHGTFDLSDEPIGEPQRWLQNIKEEKQEEGILFTDIGRAHLL